MTDLPRHPVRFADLPNRKHSHVTLTPDAPQRAALAKELDVLAVKKLKFDVALIPMGKRDWRLEGKMGATVQQACVVTLEPISTRIDEDVTRIFVSDYDLPDDDEFEVPEDDTSDPLPDTLDLYDVALEALTLSLPAYPRKDGVETGTGGRAMFTEPGKEVMTDEQARPFAGLGALRDALANKGESDE